MTRLSASSLIAACILTVFSAPPFFVTQVAPAQTQAPAPPDESSPPEEDEGLIPEKVPLNPMEADRSIRVGNFYMRKGKFRAALQRFELATKYNPSSPDAFFKVGEAEEKLKNEDAAKTAFEKVVRLAPNSKLGQEAQKKIGRKG